MELTDAQLNINTLQSTGLSEFNSYLAGVGSFTVPNNGYLIARSTVHQTTQNIFLYYCPSDFRGTLVDGENNLGEFINNEAGFVFLLEHQSSGKLIPVFFVKTEGTYSSITREKKRQVKDFWRLLTTGEFLPTDFFDNGEGEETLGEELDDLDITVDTGGTTPTLESETVIRNEGFVNVETNMKTRIQLVQLTFVHTTSKGVVTGTTVSYMIQTTTYPKDADETTLTYTPIHTGIANQDEAEILFAQEVTDITEIHNQVEFVMLSAERHTEVVTQEVSEVWDKTTRWLLTDSASPITNVEGPNGSFSWKHNDQVLELTDHDLSTDTSGSLFFKCPKNMEINLRFTTSSNSINDDIRAELKTAWEKGSSHSEEQEIIESDEYFGGDYPNANEVFNVPMTAGDKLSVDIDQEDSLVTNFKLTIDGDEYRIADNVDDEFYLNISNPTIFYTAEVTVVTDGHGNIISEDLEIIDGGNLFDDEGNKKKRDDKDKDRQPGFQWKWYHTGAVILVGVTIFIGVLLWRRTGKTAQNQVIAQPVVAQNPAPVVVNVEGSP